MSKKENTSTPIEKKAEGNIEISMEMNLDDTRRIKVQSPSMLVFRRFIRNKLAVVGFIILLFMFTFSFLGPLISPYGQTEVFKGLGSLPKDYAGATYNTELRYTAAEGETFGSAARSRFLLALGKNEDTFVFEENEYVYIAEGEGFYRIVSLTPMAEDILGAVNPLGDNSVPQSFLIAYQNTQENKLKVFDYDGMTYHITTNKKITTISTENDVALAMINVFDSYKEVDLENVLSYNFKLASSKAINQEFTTFSVGELAYSILYDDGNITILDPSGFAYAEVSDIIVNPLDQDTFLTVNYKSTVRDTIVNREEAFTYTHNDGSTITYTIDRVINTFNIKKETQTELIRIFELTSPDHPLGLDNNGMDVMTRLMYGGQVSLLVGFVVVTIEIILGVIIGGVSGYFGGWVDTALMRFVDLFNSIPFWPIVLILGSVMDSMEVEPMARIFSLMIVLGLLGWTGVARIVRGQILSLRELDFMVATEATGIRTTRRIFRHLIPNIIPLLIVQATAGLGGIIITEATLGFLGLGVKYPLASWGSIINIASDAYVMTNFWFMWIPAGLLILLTVLGFNFVGDGLRDAFDPKMKR